MSFDLGWGEPVCVRETLDEFYNPHLGLNSILKMSYPQFYGEERLIAHLKKSLGYKHILITNGATGAINIVLRALKNAESRMVCVTEKPFFPFYPDIIKKCGYKHKTGILSDRTIGCQRVFLVDIPSNPWGKIYSIDNDENNVIWDSVYANKVYVNSKTPIIVPHRVCVGSFSKMLGLTGVRVGWIGTNSDEDFKMFQDESLYENCGVSLPSQNLMVDILNTTNMDMFYTRAQDRVNNNRGEFQKLDQFFDGQIVPMNGMFYPCWVTNHALKILDRANVKVITLDTMGDSTLIRFNLAQNNTITRNAVKAIKTADRLK